MPARIVIVGGGITGLAAAYHLERLTDASIELFETSGRLGGKVQTCRIGKLLVEEGPDAFFTRKPGVMELVAELGLESELVEPLQNEFFMLVGGRLHPVPRALAGFSVTPETLEKAQFLSQKGKERALSEPTQPPGTHDDESIHSFFTRRFGEEFSRLVAEPLLAGTHGGGANNLSMPALYPGYLRMEREHGSISAGLPHAPDGGSSKPAFLSFRNGMGTLVTALARALMRTRIHRTSHLRSWSEAGGDVTLLCVPANEAARLLEGGRVSELLGEFEHRSSAIVTLAYRSEHISRPLDGTGFLVPEGEHPTVTGMTWSSRKWAGRAPDGTTLVRVFLGGDREKLVQSTDEELIELATQAITPILMIDGEPVFEQVPRWIDGLPQYTMGHLDRLAVAKTAMSEFPNVHWVGTSYGGVGIPDCLRQAKELAERISGELK